MAISGCNLKVLVIGSPTENPIRFANALERFAESSGYEATVAYCAQEEAAVAELNYVPGHFGDHFRATKIDLDVLIQSLNHLGSDVKIAGIQPSWSNVELNRPADYTSSARTRYWDLTGKAGSWGRVNGSISLHWWTIPLLATLLLLMPIGILAIFASAVLLGNFSKLPVKKRRSIYAKLVLNGTMCLIGVHSILFFATLPTRIFEPVAQLWFGIRFTQIALVVIPLSVFIPFATLPIMKRFEKKIFGPTVEEARRSKSIPSLYSVKPIARQKVLLRAIPSVLLLFTFLGLTFLSPGVGKSTLYILLFCLLICSSFMNQQAISYDVPAEDIAKGEARARQAADRLTGIMQMPTAAVRILKEVRYGKLSALADAKGIGVTAQAAMTLSDAALDFLIAHELAHIRLRHVAKRRFVAFVFAALLGLPIVFLFGFRNLIGANSLLLLIPMATAACGFAPMFLFLRKSYRRNELEADELAVKTTGDVEGAIACLQTLVASSSLPGVHDTDSNTHPAIELRIDKLRHLQLQPTTPVLQAMDASF